MSESDVERNIRQMVKEQLEWDDRVPKAENIQVEVEEGTVKLKGEVPTHFSRIAAEEDAWTVPCVLDVENELEVKQSKGIKVPEDQEIKAAIEQMLRMDNRIDAQDIIAEANSGVVTLYGTVDAFWKKHIVEQDVHRVIGVVSLVDKLKITPVKPDQDGQVRETIMNALKRNSVTNNSEIDVDVHNGEVTLTGAVPSNLERYTALDIARFTTGVTKVNNNLKIIYYNPRTYA